MGSALAVGRTDDYRRLHQPLCLPGSGSGRNELYHPELAIVKHFGLGADAQVRTVPHKLAVLADRQVRAAATAESGPVEIRLARVGL